MSLDAIIIADFGVNSLSGSNPLRLIIEGRIADIQVVQNYINNGCIVPPIEEDGVMSWASAPRLNGIALFSYLKKHDIEVELINDFYAEEGTFRDLLKRDPKAVVISTTFIYRKKDLFLLIEKIRSIVPEIPIIVGGPFVYLSYLVLNKAHEKNYSRKEIKEDYLFLEQNDAPIDLCIVSLRGEPILHNALDRIIRGMSLRGLPNTARLIEGNYQFTERIDDITNHEELIIDWDSLPDSIFQSGVVPMQASSGCPHRCAFCNFVKDLRLAHIKPLDRLIAEIKAVERRGVKYVWFVDDNFRLGKSDLEIVCQRFVDEGLSINWMSFVRADVVKGFDFNLLRKAGCSELCLGLESADPHVLENMNKKADPKLYAEVVREILAAGINCSSYFIFGHPGETDESVAKTIEFIKSLEHPELEGVFSWSIYPFMLAPMSPIYEPDLRNKHGLEGYMNSWKHKTMDSDQAKKYIKKAFFELDNSGPIYRGDNQEILSSLTPSKRKNFEAVRHRLGKKAALNQLNEDLVIKLFSDVLT